MIREARRRAGLTQRELAERSGTSQSRLSTYESGTTEPAPQTLQRLLAAARPLPSQALDRHREAVVDLARRHGLVDVRVSGSVAQGRDHAGSDIDLVVTASPSATLFDVNGFVRQAEKLLGCPVDVVTRGSLSDDSPILRDALRL